MLTTTPIKINNFFQGQFPHNPGGDHWLGDLTPTLQLYKPEVGEQGWGVIAGFNFAILDDAMLRSWDQVITGINEFRGRLAVRWPLKPDEAPQRRQVDNANIMMLMGGY